MRITVCVCGAFDPLHSGHLEHIREAKKLGDYLTVILNPDEDVIKKRGMVFMPLGQRYQILKSLRDVDEVVIAIDGDGTVANTIKMLKPEILAKGGDRTPDNMPRNEINACKEVGCKIIYGVGKQLASSTELLKRIQHYKGGITHKPSGQDFR